MQGAKFFKLFKNMPRNVISKTRLFKNVFKKKKKLNQFRPNFQIKLQISLKKCSSPKTTKMAKKRGKRTVYCPGGLNFAK